MKKFKNKKNTFTFYMILISLTLLSVLCGVFLPGRLLTLKSSKELNQTETAPNEYYAGASSAIARNASSQLSDYQKSKLISGIWESLDTEASVNESTIHDYEAVNLAKEGLENLYNANLYPISLKSGYGSWYSWTTKLYKATDTTFQTYTAYYWIISFVRYDESEKHTVLMTEEGTILFAHAYNKDKLEVNHYDLKNNLTALYDTNRKEYSLLYVMNPNTLSDKIPSYPHLELSDLTYSAVHLLLVGRTDITTSAKFKEYFHSESADQLEFYYIYQYNDDNDYIIGIVPYTE